MLTMLQHREQGVDLLRPQLALKRLTCGGSAPQPELMRWFLEKSLDSADLTGTDCEHYEQMVLTTDMCKRLTISNDNYISLFGIY